MHIHVKKDICRGMPMITRLRNHKKDILCFLLFCAVAGLFLVMQIRKREESKMMEVMNQQESPEVIKIALTFDDGPHPYYTKQLLDGLKERGVKATFFITGQNAKEHPEIVKRIFEEGHIIGNHTYSHMQLTKSNGNEFKQELIDTNEVIKEITGEDVIYVRPPYGCWDKQLETELNLFPVLWSIDPQDWCSSDAGCIARHVIAKAEDNDIVLMHDCYKTTVTAALDVIDSLQKKGYDFVTVEELLFD